MPTAYTYFRFSSGSQAKGSSLHRQEQRVSEWLNKNPLYKLGTLEFIDKGRSGYSGAHLKYDLGRILSAIEAKDIKAGDAILVEAVDRIGRLPPTEMFDLILSITKEGVSLVTVEDDKVYSKDTLDTDTSSLFILAGKVQQAHEYSKRLSELVRGGYEAKRKKAMEGERVNRLTPYWLTSEGDLIPDKAKAVSDCIDLYLKGYGPRKILEKLEPQYPELKKKHPSTLMRWFKNRALVGDWAIYKAKDDPNNSKVAPSEIIKNVYPPLVDRATYYEIQKQLKIRSKVMSKAASYELSGLCVCGVCDAAFYYQRRKYKDRPIIYGFCSNYLKRGLSHCTNNKTWPYEVMLYIHDTTSDFHLQVASEIENHRAASKELVVKEQELIELKDKKIKFSVMLSEFPGDQQLLAVYTDLRTQEDRLNRDIQALENQDSKPVLSSFFSEAAADSVMLNATLKEVGYRITIKGSVASVDAGGALLKYKLLRRSQNYGCYIVHHQCLPEAFEELGVVRPQDWNYDDRYLAINRDGLLAEAPTDQKLINILRDLKSHNDIV